MYECVCLYVRVHSCACTTLNGAVDRWMDELLHHQRQDVAQFLCLKETGTDWVKVHSKTNCLCNHNMDVLIRLCNVAELTANYPTPAHVNL